MKQAYIISKFFKSFVFLVMFFTGTVSAQVMVYCPVTMFEEPVMVVDRKGGECSIHFITNWDINDAYINNLRNTLNTGFKNAGINWAFFMEAQWVDYEANTQRGRGILTLRISKNNTGSNRSFYLQSVQKQILLVTQSHLDITPDPDKINIYDVSSDCIPNCAFPERMTTVTLSGSQSDVLYIIDGDTLQGTGAPLVFKKKFTEGSYVVRGIKGSNSEVMAGTVNISYYPFLKAGLCKNEVIKDMLFHDAGGCGMFWFSLPFLEDMTSSQIEELDSMLGQINAGKLVDYPGLFLRRRDNVIEVLTGPNYKGNAWPFKLIFAVSDKRGGKTFQLTLFPLPASSPLCTYTLALDKYVSPRQFSLKLDNYQLAVKYKLYRDGTFVQEKIGVLDSPLVFANLSGGGTYYAEAHYCDTVVRMNGSIYIDGGEGVTNYVKKNDYYRENDPVATYTYYDGLGRELQTRVEKAGRNNKDMITFREYDNMGRESKVYLPYSLNGGGFRLNPVAEQDSFYRKCYGSEHYAWSEQVFDNSPQDRLIEISSPGYENRLESGHTIKNNLRKNKSADGVKHYVLNDSSLNLPGFYGANTLTVSETVDEDGIITTEYKDVAGRVICKSQSAVSTYYIYDESGKLRYILPPAQDSLFTSGTRNLAELSKYCYYMEYDTLGRLYKQYIPGAGYTVYLYDKRDRKVFVQNAKMRSANQWHFTKYDCHNRPVIEGICTGTEAQLTEMLAGQEVFGEKRGNLLHGYTNDCPPVNVTASDCMNITYYDDYTWAGQEVVSFSLVDTLGVMNNNSVKGQVTGKKTKVLGSSSDQWLISAHYYDQYYQVVQTVSELYPSGMEIVSNHHDFAGNVDRVKVKQATGDQVTEYMKYMDYDRHGRLLSTQQEIFGDVGNGKVELTTMEYDELGRLAKERWHNGRDSLLYSYDLRGRQTGYKSSGFSYELGFEKCDPSFAGWVHPRYNGMVSHFKWAHGPVPEKGYSYTYDQLGQLNSAVYFSENQGTWETSSAFGEKNISYDLNGNLKRLVRYDGSGRLLHDIEYDYACPGNGNAVSSVKVGGVTSGNYVYDANGNLTEDGLRGIHITYNALNLPLSMTRGTENISYIYNARGEKLEERVGSSSTYYRDVMVYNGDHLSYIRHPGGVIRKVNNNYVYDYFLTDHLGNTRVVLEAGGNRLTPVQQTDYYPFGLSYSYNNLHLNKYLFSGKELQDVSLGGELLGLYDFGSRFYDPMLGRWFCQDPALQLVSPYVFCGNNPVCFVDPDGEFVFAAILIGVAISVAIDYAVQVAVNYATGYRGADAWFRQVDFFDVAVSGVIGGMTAGYGAAASAGHKIGQVGSFVVKNPKLLSLGETALTSTIDITGEGWQDVSYQQVGTRLVSAGLTYAARTGLQKTFKNKRVIIQSENSSDFSISNYNNFYSQGLKCESKAVKKFWPDNNGALGKWEEEFLMPGTEIDRYGKRIGTYFSPKGTPFEMRALPFEHIDNYNAYKVLKPFRVQKSLVMPAFGKRGLGVQYLSPVNTNVLLKHGIIEPIK